MRTQRLLATRQKNSPKGSSKRRYFLLLLLITLFYGCYSDSPSASATLAIQGIYTGSISRNAQFSVIGSINHGGSLWKLANKERLFDWNHQAGNYSNLVATALSHNGEIAVTADERRFVFWKTATGESIGFWSAPDKVLDVALSGDGSFALVGLKDYSALYINVKEGQILNKFYHQGAIESVSLSGDGALGITGSDDRSAVYWDLVANKELHRWQFENTVNLVHLSAAGDLAILSSQHEKFLVWDLKSKRVLLEKADRSKTITAAAFLPGQNSVLIGDSMQQIEQWALTSPKRIKRWRLPGKNIWRPARAKIYGIGLNENGSQFFSITSEGVLQEWNL